MNYLVSSFDCVVIGEKKFDVLKGVKYELSIGKDTTCFVCPENNASPYILEIQKPNDNMLKLSHNLNTFYFMFSDNKNKNSVTKINYKNKEVFVSLFSSLIVSIDGVLICEENVDSLKYSHYEIFEDICLIYFTGKRNYLIAIQDEKVCFASYYDECNVEENEKYFMCKMYDSLNHGKVCHIREKECNCYLVYLDNDELQLKQEFIPFVFLDCLKAGNLKYCNSLLADNLSLKNVEDIKEFFPLFDFYYPLDESTFMLSNKNTLAGIFKFDIENNKINNIQEN